MSARKKESKGIHVRNFGEPTISYCGEDVSTESGDSFVNVHHVIENIDKQPVCEDCRKAVIDIINKSGK